MKFEYLPAKPLVEAADTVKFEAMASNNEENVKDALKAWYALQEEVELTEKTSEIDKAIQKQRRIFEKKPSKEALSAIVQLVEDFTVASMNELPEIQKLDGENKLGFYKRSQIKRKKMWYAARKNPFSAKKALRKVDSRDRQRRNIDRNAGDQVQNTR